MNEIIWYILFAVIILLLVLLLLRVSKRPGADSALRMEITNQLSALSNMILETMTNVSQANTYSVELLKQSVEAQLREIQTSVDEKLHSTLKSGLDSSFKRVSEQLQQVYTSMGEVRTLTGDIGDLKSILSNVKTRGLWGEIQLHKLLEDFMAPGQYIENARIGENNFVEFAIKFPQEDGEHTLLPIDSKFPLDKYTRLVRCTEGGDTAKILEAKKDFVSALVLEAKKISEKYIKPPKTTEFALMFLPSEGLYSEAVRLGLLEQMQSKWRIMLTGPSTLCALLTSLQTGFKTIAIQKHSTVILGMLAAIKTEFDTFAMTLQKTQNSLSAAQNHLESVQKRTVRIQSQLKDTSELPL